MCGLNPELDIAGPTYGIGVLQGNHLLTRDGRISVTGGEKKLSRRPYSQRSGLFIPVLTPLHTSRKMWDVKPLWTKVKFDRLHEVLVS